MYTPILAEALAGLSASRPEDVGPEARFGRNVLCFLHHTPGDLRIGRWPRSSASARAGDAGRGCARSRAVLLAASPHTPALPGVAEMTGRDLSPLGSGRRGARAVLRPAAYRMDVGTGRLDRRGAPSHRRPGGGEVRLLGLERQALTDRGNPLHCLHPVFIHQPSGLY